MKVALVLCPQWDNRFPIYSMALMSALLKARGHDVGLFNLNQELLALNRERSGVGFEHYVHIRSQWADDHYVDTVILPAYRTYLESIVERILSQGCRVVAFTVYFSNSAMSLCVARMLKQRDPGVIIVFGGPSCLIFEQCLRFSGQDAVDAVVYGEADRSFPALVDEIARSGRPAAAAGVLLRSDPASWKEQQDPIENLDDLPFADYADVDLSLYTRPVKTIHSCRGCVRRCAFCADWREMTYRQMSPERMYGEIEHQLMQAPQVTNFLFGDSLVNGSMKSIMGFCDRVIDARIKIQWRGFAIARPQMTPEVLATMRQAGCEVLMIGVESGSASILKEIEKGVTPALNAEVLKNCAAAGVRTEATWLVGYPGETEEMFKESLEFIRENASSISVLALSLFWLEPTLKTAGRYQFESDNAVYWKTKDGKNTFPVRLDRMARLMETARAHGINASFEGHSSGAEFLEHRDALSNDYRRWSIASDLQGARGSAGSR